MQIKIDEVIELGEVLLPHFLLDFEQAITTIYTDVTRLNFLKKQLLNNKSIYVHTQQLGYYERLTVEETFRFYNDLYNGKQSTAQLITEFGFEQQRKTRVSELSMTQRQVLSFIQPYLDEKKLLVFIEPFQNLQQNERKILMHILTQLKQVHRNILILSNNLEHLISVGDEIFRLDEDGLHPLDVKEEQADTAPIETTQLKIEKIPTKKNDKIILFNPPEIDYIESVEGEVYIYVAGEGYLCAWTLNELEKRLIHFGFFRCHRSYIVNLQKVREIISWTRNSYSLVLQGAAKSEVPLSRNKLSELKEIVGI
ncbi:LytTR family transcriptional regulator DNA-binding domain-containing protein [Solibacillus sp. FSL R7-0668]|uniref:LytTR family transcriptional regulator DNA-binding domain-containing protein n=1 Tax=Solibacillus sp. FSL R7-0668 TaxID=2921688 RepID=UPI0030FAECD7